MTNIKLAIAVIVLAVMLGLTIKSNYTKSREIDSLKNSIAAYNKAQTQSVKTITKIQEKIKYVKEDCYHTDINSGIIDWVRNK
jgi:uncharacterized protein YoxC